jgi:hypothetical protein
MVQANLTDSYELLMGFAEKHLLDKFAVIQAKTRN